MAVTPNPASSDGILPPVLEPVAGTSHDWRRGQSPALAFSWLAAGWRDFAHQPFPSLAYGLLVFAASLVVILGLVRFGQDFILFPALSGFLVVAPLVAMGLYEKSRRLTDGEPVALADMVYVRAESGGQVVFCGLLLCLLMLLWNRAAVLLYALFFGLLPFGGLRDVVPLLLGTPEGWGLLIVGSAVGGLFAAFSFSISVFAIPRLLARRTDALTAMGQSMALVWGNLPVMLVWASIVAVLFGLSVVTGLVGLIVVFPVLGHATWHAYDTMWRAFEDKSRKESEAGP